MNLPFRINILHLYDPVGNHKRCKIALVHHVNVKPQISWKVTKRYCSFLFEAFSGNSNADSVVMYKLQHPVIAQYLRILPLDWNSNGRVGLRLEAYGCQYSTYLIFTFHLTFFMLWNGMNFLFIIYSFIHIMIKNLSCYKMSKCLRLLFLIKLNLCWFYLSFKYGL